MSVCCPKRYIKILETRGLRKVDDLRSSHSACSHGRAVSGAANEIRLYELKQRLAVISSVYHPRHELLH
jgi:hypothetical protein